MLRCTDGMSEDNVAADGDEYNDDDDNNNNVNPLQ